MSSTSGGSMTAGGNFTFPHSKFNYMDKVADWKLGYSISQAAGSSSGGGGSSSGSSKGLFRPSAIYESATGMKIGQTDSAASSSVSGVSNESGHMSMNTRQKDLARTINRNLRNVAWELTREQPLNAHIEKTAISVGGGVIDTISHVVHDKTREIPQVLYEEEEEAMYEIMIPWLCRNVVARSRDFCESVANANVNAKCVDSDAKDTAGDTQIIDIFQKLDSLFKRCNYFTSPAVTAVVAATTTTTTTTTTAVGDNDHDKVRDFPTDTEYKLFQTISLIPELTKVFWTLGIQVTEKALIELCRRYPANINICNYKWDYIRKEEKKKIMINAQEKISCSRCSSRSVGDGGGGGSKGGPSNGNRGDKERADTDIDTNAHEAKKCGSSASEHTVAESKGTSNEGSYDSDTKGGGGSNGQNHNHNHIHDAPQRDGLDTVISMLDGAYYDNDIGLDIPFFLTELKNGRAVIGISALTSSSAFMTSSKNGSGNDYTGDMMKGIEKVCKGNEVKIAELRELLEGSTGIITPPTGTKVTVTSLLQQLSSCVTVSHLHCRFWHLTLTLTFTGTTCPSLSCLVLSCTVRSYQT